MDDIDTMDNRRRRFFEDGGICARFEERGDDLIEFEEIASIIADLNGVPFDAVLRRFLFSVGQGGLGWRHRDIRRVDRLVDLTDFPFSPGQYPLRPSILTVQKRPLRMRARRSVWVDWLRAQGWQLPPDFERRATKEQPAPPEGEIAQQRRKGPVPGTADTIAKERRKLFLEIDEYVKKRHISPSMAAAFISYKQKLPGRGTDQNNKAELVRQYKKERT
jgi:hypothetical protein